MIFKDLRRCEMLEKIFWLGHSSIRIAGEKVIYIDPWKIGGGKADLILISHSHFDHLSVEDVEKIRKPETVILTTPDSAAKLAGDVREIRPGDAVTVKGIRVEAVPAYNTIRMRSPGVPFHPREEGWLGFVVTAGGKRIYYAGDTDLTPEMKDVRADIAILPVGGTYTMNADEAAELANLIRPGEAIPIHWGDIVGSAADAERFKALCRVPVEIKPVTP
jgi:L-ascorbate metabolism protein UlaG (beta-lactamase superfamily)